VILKAARLHGEHAAIHTKRQAVVNDLQRMMAALTPGERVFISGGAGEPTALLEAWASEPERCGGLVITSSAIPGMNRFDFSRLHPTARVRGLFMQPAFAALQRSGRFEQIPTSYAGFSRLIRAQAQTFDTVIVQASAPDANGRCSLGPTVEFLPLALSHCKRAFLLMNASTPRVAGAPSVGLKDFALTAQTDTTLPTYAMGPIDELSKQIAQHVAPWIGDGARLQTGIGKVPGALVHLLRDRKGLVLSGGMFGDGTMTLEAAGALSTQDTHLACALVGEAPLYDWARERSAFHLRGCEQTHDPAQLSAVQNFIAVNSAIEVDLWGQCALEHASQAAVSGAGGAPDFARAARLNPTGLSVVALPATAVRGTLSRIVATLTPPAVSTLSRTDVDLVVTEYGVADLRALGVYARAEALIEIAAPAFRSELKTQWAAQVQSL